MIAEFFVAGIPQPKGSTRSFFSKKQSRTFTTNANPETRPWEQAIRAEAEIMKLSPVLCPVNVVAIFYLPRLKGHFTTKGLLKSSAPEIPQNKPDLDKLVRTLLDALTAVAYVDDCQVTSISIVKWFADGEQKPGVHVLLTEDRGHW